MVQDAAQRGRIRLVGALAGIGSGVTKVAVGHGFDTIKTRMQCAPPGTYRGAFDVLRKTVAGEGVLALYKGATPPLVAWAAIDSLLMGSLHNYRLSLLRHGMTDISPTTGLPRLTLLSHGIAGLMAGITSTIVATPMEHVKVRLQLQMQRSPADREFKGPIDCIRRIHRAYGVRGLWTGFSGCVASRSNFGWMFLSFEVFMRGFTRLDGTRFEMSTGAANFLSGGFGALIYWIMAIPADNVKNRMMSYPYPAAYPLSRATSSQPSFAATARRIYRHEGWRGFTRGLGPCLLRAFPVNASAFFVYEGLMRAFGAEKTRQ